MMRTFHYKKEYEKLLTPDVVGMLIQIHEYKGQQNLFIESKADALSQLVETAKIQSTDASNRIEGIFTSSGRLEKLVRDKMIPQNRSEQEIAGYRDVLATIHTSHDYIPLRPNMILQLHRDLYKYSAKSIGGHYKTSDNIIEETDVAGQKHVRFIPVSAFETPMTMEALCEEYACASANSELDTLLLIPLFVLDFLCIHPFEDGNGRMCRLLTLLLLYREGYLVGKYISIERLIEQTKDAYYETLYAGSQGWHEETNDYLPFVRYLLGVILAAYRDFSTRVENLVVNSSSKPERVREWVKQSLVPVAKSEIVAKCPDVSAVTVKRTIQDMLAKGEIIKVGAGRATKYIWNHEKE